LCWWPALPDRTEAIIDWPFAGADAFSKCSSVFSELGRQGGLAAGAGDLAVVYLPEGAAQPARKEENMAPPKCRDAGVSSSWSGDGDQKPTTEEV
jgi:hypothetical protein